MSCGYLKHEMTLTELAVVLFAAFFLATVVISASIVAGINFWSRTGRQTMWDVFVLAFAVAVGVGDTLWRKIPNSFAAAGLVVGFAYHAWHKDLLPALIGFGLGFAIGLALFHLGAIGGGDVKLLMALGALLGYHRWFVAMEVSILVAALIAAIQVFRQRGARQVVRNMGAILRELMQVRFAPHPVINVRNAAMIRAPFGVAAAVGTCAALLVK